MNVELWMRWYREAEQADAKTVDLSDAPPNAKARSSDGWQCFSYPMRSNGVSRLFRNSITIVFDTILPLRKTVRLLLSLNATAWNSIPHQNN